MARLPIAAEDRFALIDLSGPDDALLPDLRLITHDELIRAAEHRLLI